MDCVIEILFICVVVFNAALISANTSDEFDDCVVKYLHEKELNKTNRWNLLPTFPDCPTFEADVQSLKSLFFFQTSLEYPGSSFCLTDKFDREDAIDYVLKMHIIIRMDNVNYTQIMVETRSQFKDLLKQIAYQCGFDDKNFIKIFGYTLPIKNETTEAYQHGYCLAEYAIDKKLENLKYAYINPHNIDPESVNCTEIVDVERDKYEMEFREKVSALPLVSQSYLDTYKIHKVFDWQVALIFLPYLHLHERVRAYERDRFDNEKITKLLASLDAV